MSNARNIQRTDGAPQEPGGLLTKWRLARDCRRNHSLSALARLLFAELLHLEGRTGRLDPTVRALQQALGRSRRQILDALQELEAEAWLTVERSPGNRSDYRINYSRAQGGAEIRTGEAVSEEGEWCGNPHGGGAEIRTGVVRKSARASDTVKDTGLDAVVARPARAATAVPAASPSVPVVGQDPVEGGSARVERAGPPPSPAPVTSVERPGSPPVSDEAPGADLGVLLHEAEALLEVPEIAAVAVEPPDRDPSEADRAAIDRARVALASRGWSIGRIEQTAAMLREAGTWGEAPPMSPAVPYPTQVVALALGGLDLEQLGEDRVRADSRELVDRIDGLVGQIDWLVDRLDAAPLRDPMRIAWPADADEEQELEEGFAW